MITRLYSAFILPLALIISLFLWSLAVLADDKSAVLHDHSVANKPVVIVITTGASPLTVVTSPKTPRQPVPASDGADYLKTIPGFSQIKNGGTNGDPVFRGMFGSRLRILTNNGEMLGACPSRMDAPTSYISPESYDRLTLIKGPGTVLWGPGNSAGTLRFEREPLRFDEPGIKGNANILGASNDRWDGNLDFGAGNEAGYLRLIGNKSRAGDYKDGNGRRIPSAWDKWNTDVAFGWTPDRNTLLELTAGVSDGEARYAGRSMDGAQFKRESVGLRFQKERLSQWLDKIEANAYYNYADHIMDNFSLRPLGGMMMPMSMELDRQTFGGRIISTWLWDQYELKSGIDTQSNRHRSWRNASWKEDARFHDYGIFAELEWEATAENKFITGLRFDQVDVDNATGRGKPKRRDTLPAGFLRLEHVLAQSPVIFYAGLGHTQRFPDYWELFSPTRGPNGDPAPFDNLKTEKTTQLDIGGKYKGEKMTGWISAFAANIHDFILFRYDPLNLRISESDNVDAMSMGGETGITYALTEHLRTETSLAYTWAKNRDDHKPLPQIPPLDARIGISWEQGDWTTTGLLRLVNRQTRLAINEGNVVGKDFDQSPGFGVFSANTAYRWNQQVLLSAGVDNLFDKTYSEHLNLAGNSSFGYSAGMPINETGRTFWAKMNINF